MSEVMSSVTPWLLEKLACPLSKAPVVQVKDWLYSTDSGTRRRYPIRDGIPNMLIEESEVVEPEEFARVMASVGREVERQDGRVEPERNVQ